MNLFRTKWGRAGLGLGVAAGFLGFLELMATLAGFGSGGLYEGDPNTTWWLKSGLSERVEGPGGEFLLETNALGLRGEAPPDEGPWTLVLGCSTTLGWGVDEEDSWVGLLADGLGEPVVNGGQPGWSTHQASERVGALLDLGPSRVIIGYIVRDAQYSVRPDADARASPWWVRSALASFLGRYRTSVPVDYAIGAPDESRVPPDAYRRNLERLIERSGEAEVVLLSFPHQGSMEPWEDVQEELGTTWKPQLDRSLFFESDPVHLNVEGNRALADWMVARLSQEGR